ncbi:hypothetical protein BTH55_05000 [Lactobacillus delbrueckii subsp. bulgaricus]|nr:hypothetical protein [Lactobacillus delbrueckii subsp. bulgaricus]MBT8806712.1 hypothetical protein [Lactobacillus delbrueckii subsp. bulgaricus]MBT8812799.1 hypothetical protein [Lactobacillus delbrueckii subsp. bulgaricus]MBT8819162.1 hypothetical protein [Lactobacillus delbrueckii subsp. bulgaricus]MBT8820624.1 hypothetical protein [Lactobacillus delbrueckii subsp. bulgaricus]
MRKKGRIKMALGAIFILLAGLLLAHNLIEDYRAGSSAKAIVRTIEQAPKTAKAKKSGKDAIKVNACSGYLNFPTLNLTLPVASKWRFSQLEVSPATYTGTAKDRDWIVAGHNFVNHFGRLN